MKQNKEYQRTHRIKFRTTPHECDCGNMGVKWTSTGWACQRCVNLEVARLNIAVSEEKTKERMALPKWTAKVYEGWRNKFFDEQRIQVGDSLKYLDRLLAANAPQSL